MKRTLLGLFAASLLLFLGCPAEEPTADYLIRTEMPSNTQYKVAAVQYFPQHATLREGAKEENIQGLLALCEEAAQNEAKIIVTPEMGITGYGWRNREEISPYVEEVPGPTTERFAALAQEYGVYICFSLAEVERPANVYYNTAVLVGPNGYIAKYRKQSSWVCEPRWAMDGDLGFKVFGTEYGNLSILICMDCDHLETARMVTLMGADVILYPTAYPGIMCPTDAWISRTFENGCYLIAANWWGEERGAFLGGGSCILNPDGSIQSFVDYGENTIVYGEVDIERVRRRQFADTGENKVLDRRPELYHNVVLNTYLFTPSWFFGQYGESLPDGAQTVLAAAQFRPEPGDVDANLAAMERMVAQQMQEQPVGLIVFPELATCGVPNAAEFAEAIPGPTTERLVALAQTHNIHLVVGMPEEDGGNRYNSAVLIGPEGLIGKYRKTHLDHLDKQWATAGDVIDTFDTPIGRIGILIGYDALFPEADRHLAAWGADIIAVPSALSFPRPVGHPGSRAVFDDSLGPVPIAPDPNHWHYFRGIGGHNEVYCVFANQYGTVGEQEYMGVSAVFPPEMFFFPRPEIIAPPTGDVIVTQAADTTFGVPNDYGYATNITRSKDYLTFRMPEQYKLLVTPHEHVPIVANDMVTR